LEDSRRLLDSIQELNQHHYEATGHPEIQTRMAQYEMAFRMQTSVPELSDLSDEPESTFRLYGEEARTPGSFAFNCLMARRLAERGVRFTQLYHSGWDHHFNLPAHLPQRCQETDRASAALITDLKQRGLLEDTIVVWGGEFGRTAFSQNGKVLKSYGRDHHANCFTQLVAGGGFRSGLNYGETDDFSYRPVKDEVTVHDLHATILHQLGIDHERLTYFAQGRRYRLTDVEGRVVRDLLV
jgi:arylsulfatase A-like enzyme